MRVYTGPNVEDKIKECGGGRIEASNAKEFASYQCDAVKASAVEKSTGEGVFSVY